MEYVHISAENLSAVYAVYNRCLIHDPLPADWFEHKTLGDPDFDPAMTCVAVDNGEPRGFLMGVRRDTDDGVDAGIKIVAVDEQYRGRGIATEMLARVEAEAKRRGATGISVGFTRPNYIMAGIDVRYTNAVAFLIRRGYVRRGDTYNMDVDLLSSDWDLSTLEAKLGAKGITCRRLPISDKPLLEDYLVRAEHSAGWRYQVVRALEQQPSGVFVAEQDGRVIAFACYDGVRPGWFGPMGTLESARGGGIGTLTYLNCLRSMREVGYRVCEVNCVGPLYFYSKTSNARVSRICWQYKKDL